MKRLVVLALCLGLAGCAMAARMDAQQTYRQAATAYRDCVAAQGPQACERQRVIMESDERVYTNVTAGTTGNSSANNIVVRGR